jgi:phage terminase Nu1 subunit (DNA packaging protein)
MNMYIYIYKICTYIHTHIHTYTSRGHPIAEKPHKLELRLWRSIFFARLVNPDNDNNNDDDNNDDVPLRLPLNRVHASLK